MITSLAARTAAIVEPWLTLLALAAWCVPLCLLLPPLYRLARGRLRSLDAIWLVMLLGVVNRIASDFAHVPAALQHLSATIVAALLAACIWSYQHADR